MEQNFNFPNKGENPLVTINNRWWNKIATKLSAEQSKASHIAIKSSRGTTLATEAPLNVEVTKNFGIETASEFMCRLDHAVSGVNRNLILNNKVLDREKFEEEVNNRWIRLYPHDLDQDKLLNLWIQYQRGDLKKQSIWDRTKDSASAINRELGLTTKLGLMCLGVGLSRVNKRLSTGLIGYLANTQMIDDILSIESSNSKDKDKTVKNIIELYGVNEVKNNVISHPSFARRIRDSLALQIGIYTLPRQVLGWASFVSLLAYPEFRDWVDNDLGRATLISGLSLSSLAVARMFIDTVVLKKAGYSPDVLETSVALTAGKINNKEELVPNKWAGLIGAPLDIAVSSFVLPYSLAWATLPPYSVPAYLLAIGVDQAVFSATNVGFLAWNEQRKNIK